MDSNYTESELIMQVKLLKRLYNFQVMIYSGSDWLPLHLLVMPMHLMWDTTKHVFHVLRKKEADGDDLGDNFSQMAIFVELINLVEIQTDDKLYLSIDDIWTTCVKLLTCLTEIRNNQWRISVSSSMKAGEIDKTLWRDNSCTWHWLTCGKNSLKNYI